MKPYEIKIRWNGTEFHASMQEKEGDQFRFIPDSTWPELCETINTDALATIAAQMQVIADISATLAAVRAELAAYKAQGVQAAQAVLTANDKEAANAIALDVLKNKRERDIEAADKAAAEAIAHAARLRAS